MGFHAKLIILTEKKVKADKDGPQGEKECTLWEDSQMTIDFVRITRLEKVVSDHYKHISYSSFTRAGICVVSCFHKHLFANFERGGKERLAPEILVHKSPFGDEVKPTVKIGGHTYLDCYGYRLKGFLQDGDECITLHNTAIALKSEEFGKSLLDHEIFLEGPLLWTPCSDLALWMSAARDGRTPEWRAITKDQVSLAIAQGWYHQLQELAKVGARVLFRFS